MHSAEEIRWLMEWAAFLLALVLFAAAGAWRWAHQREPEPLAEQEIEAARDAVAQALGDAYDCGRVWSAWSYGTMGPDDFSLVAEDSDRVREIALAALEAAASARKGGA